MPADEIDDDHLSFIDVNGIETRFHHAGAGDPLLLIHGGQFGQNYALGSWSRNLPGLAEDFAVYAPDKLGQGYTENPDRDEDFVFQSVCEHMLGFIRTLDLDDLHVAGHSRGGLVAAWLGLNHPERVRTATIVDSNTTAPVDSEKGFAFYADLEEKTPPGPSLASVRVEPEENSFATDHITDAFLERKLEIEQLEKVQEAAARMERLNEETFLPSVDAVRDGTLDRIQTEGLPVPTLVLWGFNDPSAPVAWGHDLYELICEETREAEMHIFNRAGHYSFREQPEAFNRVLTAFCGRSS